MSVTTSSSGTPTTTEGHVPTTTPPSGPPEQSRGPLDSLISLLRGPPAGMLSTEVLEFVSPSQALISRGPIALANHCVAIIGVMMGIFVFLSVVLNLDRIAEGSGKIISLVPETVVQPLNSGLVKTIAVAQGDLVRKGQLLAQLDPTTAVADNTAALEQVDRYKTEIDRLTSELHQVQYRPKQLSAGALVQESIFAQRAAAREAELRYYKGQIDAQRALKEQADAQIRQYAKETGVAVDVQKIDERLEADAVGSRLTTLQAVTARLETEREVLFNVDQAENAKQNVAALQGQLDNYNQQWFADVSQTITDDEVQLATYQDQLEHAALNYKLVDLRAQEDSIVLSVAPVSPGSVMQSGQTFFTLVPVNAPLEVDAQITSDQTGFVEVGQPADVKFLTFPFTHFGEASGSVRSISADTFLTGGSSGPTTGTPSGTAGDSVFTGTNPTAPFFNDVRVSIDRLNLKDVPKNFHIVPGMPVELDVKVGNRSIWDYMVEKYVTVLYEGMREPD
jgi:HlyD family secretion protein